MSEQQPPANNYSYNAYSSNQAPAAPPAPVRPKQVDLGFWLLIAAAVVSVISIPVTLSWMNSSEFKEMLAETSTTPISGSEMDAIIAVTAAITIFFSAISVVIALLVAFFIRKGHNWARIVATVFAALGAFGLINLSTAGALMTLLTVLSILLPIVAVVMLWMKPSTEYFNASKAFRQFRKYNPGA
ncbi:hypothetical protein [Arthrobacter sp. BL-252-APC-1A]|uniref:hypothetical protein n=1 Tax=Arthrobacter TaxID=1663 RepID=UPI0012B38F3D|nr:hypothetical protein [Arthrobacter sp. BL-252-APC-1A]MSR98584.1 hypothetical protein [Arthrobacter sp. BL-252-APC-1A]